MDINPYFLGTWELHLTLLWSGSNILIHGLTDFILKECDRRLLNKLQQHIPWLMMLKTDPNSGSSFHCESMTWDTPADFLRGANMNYNLFVAQKCSAVRCK
jgi:hypothetical protein